MRFTNQELNETQARGKEDITDLGHNILEFLTDNQVSLKAIYDEFDAEDETIKQQVIVLFKLKFIVETKDDKYYTAEGGIQYLEETDETSSVF